MRNIIEVESKNLVVCDNQKCDYEVPNTENDNLKDYINKSCPKCGENLLTQNDYNTYIALQKYVKWVNKWFSWLTIFEGKNQRKSVGVHVHNGLNIKNSNDGKVSK